MIFKSLDIQNFMSIRTAHIDLDNQGLVLIKGVNNSNPTFRSNGAGKSTIAESIVYVLFGRTIRGLKGDEVVNNVAKSNCKVILDLVDDDGSEYRVARYRAHKQNKNSVFLYYNGKDITPKSDAEFTKAVIELLQTDFMTFTSSILYSAESFRFTQATDAELKSAFDVMLDLKVYSDALEEVKNQMRELDYKKSEVSSRLRSLMDRKQVLEDSKSTAEERASEYKNTQKSKIKALEADIEDLQQSFEDTSEELETHKGELKELNDWLKTLKSKQSSTKKIDEAIEQLRLVTEETETDKSKCKSKQRKTNTQISNLGDDIVDYKQKISKCDKKIEDTKSKIIELKKTVGTPCPVCGKPLDENHIDDALQECNNEIDKMNKKKAEYEEAIERCNSEIEELKHQLSEYEEELEHYDEDLAEYRELMEDAQKRLDEANKASSAVVQQEREIVKVERAISSCEVQLEGFEKSIETKESQIEEIKSAENPFLQQVKDYQTQLDSLNEQVDEINEQVDSFAAEEAVLQFWQKGFSNSGIKSMLLDDITPFLNKRANKYLKVLSGNRLSVNFTTQTKLKSGDMREKFQIELNNEDGGSSYISNSSGERRRVDVAVNLALCDLIASRANKKINLLFADEVFDSLDSQGIESVMQLLREIAKDKSSIFVISHNEQVQSYFDKILTVTKDGESSVVTFEG